MHSGVVLFLPAHGTRGRHRYDDRPYPSILRNTPHRKHGVVHPACHTVPQVEEREIQRLVVAAVDTQLKRIELKLKSVEELEQVGWETLWVWVCNTGHGHVRAARCISATHAADPVVEASACWQGLSCGVCSTSMRCLLHPLTPHS
jgi:hypothetical protein